MKQPTLGELAYNAYCETRNWKSFNGDSLPSYDQQKPEQIAGWEAAGKAARQAPLDPHRELQFVLDLDQEAVVQEMGRALEAGIIATGSGILSLSDKTTQANAFVNLLIGDGVCKQMAVILAAGDDVQALQDLLVSRGHKITVTTMPLRKPEPEAKKENG